MKNYVYSIETEGMVMIKMVPKDVWEEAGEMTIEQDEEDTDMIIDILEPIGICELGTWVFETELSPDEIREELNEIGFFKEVPKIQ